MTIENMMLTGILSFVALALSTWFLVVKFFKPFFKRILSWTDTWEKFMRDWAGTDAEPGRDAVPGVMERLNAIDGELKHNGGSSLKDQVARLEAEMEKADLARRETSVKIDEIYKMLKARSKSKN